MRQACWLWVTFLLVLHAPLALHASVQEPTVEELQADLRDDISHLEEFDEYSLMEVSLTLGLLGDDAYPVLLEALRAGDIRSRASAATVLGWVPGPGQEAPPDVLAALEETSAYDADFNVRETAAQTLNLLRGGSDAADDQAP